MNDTTTSQVTYRHPGLPTPRPPAEQQPTADEVEAVIAAGFKTRNQARDELLGVPPQRRRSDTRRRLNEGRWVNAGPMEVRLS